MTYDYLEETKNNIIDYVRENKDYLEGKSKEDLYDELFICDEITGNTSGSYYCNTWKAEEAISHNLDLLAEALEMFGYNTINPLEKGAEWCDSLVRCYVLGQALEEVYDEVKSILEEEGSDNE